MADFLVPTSNIQMMCAVRGFSTAAIECEICHEMTNDFRTLTIGVPSQPYDTYVEITGHDRCVSRKRNEYVKKQTLDLG